MKKVVISATGLLTPNESISNEELVASFNQYVLDYNHQHKAEIDAGTLDALRESSAEFIEKASGIKSRFVIEKSGVLDTQIMHPLVDARPDEEISIQAEMATIAAKDALKKANKDAKDVDAVYVSCSVFQRGFPAIAIEVQNALGIDGYAYDMNVACSSATFGINAAVNAIKAGEIRSALIINPEICSPQVNYRDRDSHFIFGDVCTAVLLEDAEHCQLDAAFEIKDSKLKTAFSSNIRSNFGYMNRVENSLEDVLFKQQGRKVFKEVVPMVVNLINNHLEENDLSANQLKRLWLHQANINMNSLIAQKILGEPASFEQAPIILDEYANTASAGSIIAFHLHRDDIELGDIGILCSFGAGYSIGNLILEKIPL